MESKAGASFGRRTECYPASLRLHDPFDEMKAQSVTWNIRFDPFSTIKRFEQVTLIGNVDTRSAIREAQPDLVFGGILLTDDIDMQLISGLAVFERIT